MFSILMPVWNRSEIVENSIKSVLSQTYKDYELIIIDDGSEDNLKEIIHPYFSKKVRYYKIPHSGVSIARNEGIKYAKGDLLAYLDSDNSWYPEFLSVMYDSIIKNEAEAAYCRYNVYRRYPLNQKIYLHHLGGEEFNYTKLLDANYIDLNAFIHTRKIIEDVGVFDTKLKRFVDWDLILRITSKYEPVFAQKVLVNYYQNIFENTITLNEDIRASYDFLNKKHNMKKYHKKSVIVEHDT
ncbi:glycosyltransferase family 2 protein, partial [[Eubacterium] cellulosolvens]